MAYNITTAPGRYSSDPLSEDPRDRRIFQLEAEVARLREALEAMPCACRPGVPDEGEPPYRCVVCSALSTPASELQKTLVDAVKLLRRGQKAIERQEWEKGETAQEWYHAAGTFAASVELDAKLRAEARKPEVKP